VVALDHSEIECHEMGSLCERVFGVHNLFERLDKEPPLVKLRNQQINSVSKGPTCVNVVRSGRACLARI